MRTQTLVLALALLLGACASNGNGAYDRYARPTPEYSCTEALVNGSARGYEVGRSRSGWLMGAFVAIILCKNGWWVHN